MNERVFIIILIFVSLSFSSFLIGYYAIRDLKPNDGLKALLPGFTPAPAVIPLETPPLTPTPTPEPIKAYVVKKGNSNLIMIQEQGLKPKKIIETRLPDPKLEWKNKDTLYLRSIIKNEALTFTLTLDGNLTQIK